MHLLHQNLKFYEVYKLLRLWKFTRKLLIYCMLCYTILEFLPVPRNISITKCTFWSILETYQRKLMFHVKISWKYINVRIRINSTTTTTFCAKCHSLTIEATIHWGPRPSFNKSWEWWRREKRQMSKEATNRRPPPNMCPFFTSFEAALRHIVWVKKVSFCFLIISPPK